MQKKFLEMRERFSSFYDHVRAGHQFHHETNRGHDLSHDVTVGQIALSIAPDSRTGEKTWVAALLHSMDYWKRRDEEAFKGFVAAAMLNLPSGYFSKEEMCEISSAALRHGEKNRDDQGLVQQVLQDADRLAILVVSVLFRIGQRYPRLPVVEFAHIENKNPASTYDEPCSCLDDLRNCLSEFEPQFRLPKAIVLARVHIVILNHVVNLIKDEHARLGLAGLEL